MAPPTLLRDSYYDLEQYGIDISDEPPPLPPQPPRPGFAQLVAASVSFIPPYSGEPSFIGASVSIQSPPGEPAISGITLTIDP